MVSVATQYPNRPPIRAKPSINNVPLIISCHLKKRVNSHLVTFHTSFSDLFTGRSSLFSTFNKNFMQIHLSCSQGGDRPCFQQDLERFIQGVVLRQIDFPLSIGCQRTASLIV